MHSKGTKTDAPSAAGYTVSGTPGSYTITATMTNGSHYLTDGQTVTITGDTNSVLDGNAVIQRIDDQTFTFTSANDPGAGGEFAIPVWQYNWSTPDLVDSIAGGGTFHTPQVAIDSTGYARIAYVQQSQVNGSETKSDIRLWYENSGGTSPDTVTMLTYTHATNKIFLGYGLGITGSAISPGGTSGSTSSSTSGSTSGSTSSSTSGSTSGSTSSSTTTTADGTSGGTTTSTGSSGTTTSTGSSGTTTSTGSSGTTTSTGSSTGSSGGDCGYEVYEGQYNPQTCDIFWWRDPQFNCSPGCQSNFAVSLPATPNWLENAQPWTPAECTPEPWNSETVLGCCGGNHQVNCVPE
jgi:hypothetical protein